MNNHQIPKTTSSLSIWLRFIEQRYSSKVKRELKHIQHLAQKLDLLKPAKSIFTVGGTNGKGTTCRAIETVLLAAGYSTGVYSSPHLLRYTERVRIQGKELEETAYPAVFATIEKACGETPLSWFEFNTLSALYLFKQNLLDVVILEVGLGGRLDATNIVDSDVAVITSIALDHTEFLGKDRDSIGREKAGIFRHNKPAIVGDPDMPQVIADEAKNLDAPLFRRDYNWTFFQKNTSWTFCDDQGIINNLQLPKIPIENAATALAALRASKLEIDKNIILNYLHTAFLPGRFQTIALNPQVIIDVAHNPHAAAYLSLRLAEQRLAKGKIKIHIYAVIGMLCDKDIAGTLASLKPQIDFWYCTSLKGPRGTRVDHLTQYLSSYNYYAFNNVCSAWQAAMHDAKPEDIVLVCGSFKTVAKVIKAIKNTYGPEILSIP
ncbi:MAG: bifunctional tetrahydrofolate synthase/dihydrofolate synthase [Candidatus Dasytiphilus stammeri]